VFATDCPGQTSLSDNKQLQSMTEMALQAVEKSINPPLVAPNALEGASVNLMPGGITYADGDNTATVRPLMEVRIDLADLENNMLQVRDRLARAFSVHLFMNMAMSGKDENSRMTATEVRAREQESLRQLGPVLEQLNYSNFGPMIDWLFDILNDHGVLPKPPAELMGRELSVNYISVMAQAQKLESLGSYERFLNIVQQSATVEPMLMDGVDMDFILRETASILSLAPEAIRPEEQVKAVRARRAKMVEDQQKAATLQQAAQGMSSMATTPSGAEGGGSLLDDQLSMMQAAGLTPAVGG
jgi:hypothetical protein